MSDETKTTEVTTTKPAAETKPADDKVETKSDSGAKAETKPENETKELELAMPEGVEMDQALLAQFKAHAKELGLKSDGAQKIFDLYVGAQKAAVDRHKTTLESWTKQVKEDKEMGGANFEKTTALTKRAMAKFGNPQFVEFLEATGLGSHPEMVRLMRAVGKALAEDQVPNGTQVPAQQSKEQLTKALFPTMFKE